MRSQRILVLSLALAAAWPADSPRAWAGQNDEPRPAEEPLDPDVLRKVRKLIRGTLSAETEEREKAWREIKEMGNLAVPGLLGLYRDKGTTPEMMGSILIALGDSKDPRAGPALVEMLQSKIASIRRDVARALGDSGYKEGRAALEKMAAEGGEMEDVRLFAAVAAAKLGSPAGLAALAALMKSENPQVRSRAVLALGKHGGAGEAAALEKALDDPDRSVREDAVEALRLVAKKEAWRGLVKALDDSDYRIRNNAMDALSELTRQSLEKEPKAWKEWWAKEKEKIEKEIKEKREPVKE